jgi:hypothetical protein
LPDVLHNDQISSIFPTNVQPDDEIERKELSVSSVKKPAKRKKEVAHVEDLGPTKDAKGGAQKKEVPASSRLVLQH